MALRVAAKAVGAVAVGHIVLTEVGVLKASLTRPAPPPNPVARVADCRRTASLTKVVSVMYSGGDLNATVGMRLADDVSFTDPAAACLGRSEVMEALRALAAFCSPEHMEEPLPFASFESSPSATIQFHLHQRYFRGSFLLPQGLEMAHFLCAAAARMTGFTQSKSVGTACRCSIPRLSVGFVGRMASSVTSVAPLPHGCWPLGSKYSLAELAGADRRDSDSEALRPQWA